MSSLRNGASLISVDTKSPASTSTFHNASSIPNQPSDALPISSLGTSSSGPAQIPITSSEVALDVAPNTAQNAPTHSPNTIASSSIAKEPVGSSPTPSTTDGSLTAEGETPKTTPPVPTSHSSQIIPLISSIPTSPLVSTPASSSAAIESSQPTSAAATPSPSIQIHSSTMTPSQIQNQNPTPQVSSSSPGVSSSSGIESIQDVPSLVPARPPSSTIPSQVTSSSSAHPTDESVQGPQVFSAQAVAPSSESPTFTSSSTSSSAASIQGTSIASAPAQSQVAPSQPANPAISASSSSKEAGVANPQPSAPAAPTPIPAAGAISLSTPASIPTSTPISALVSSQISAPTVAVGSPILSGTPFNTLTDVTSTTTSLSTGSIPTFVNTLPGNLRESGIPEGSQPTGQPIADPVSASTKPSTATIVGGTVGGIAAAAFIVILLWLWRRKVAGSRARESTEKGSFKPMAQRFGTGISTTLGAVKQNIGGKFAPSNVNMNRGNSQFFEAVTVEPMGAAMPIQDGAQNTTADRRKPKSRKLGLSFDHGRLFNPFSDANALMSGKVPPPSSSILSNPFADDNMILPPPVSATNRRSRGRSLGGIRSFQAPAVPPRPHSVHRESLQSEDSFSQRRDKFRSDPFDLELESRLVPPENGGVSRSSSLYSTQMPHNGRESYTSKYVSGSSLGDWTNSGPDGGSGSAAGRRDSPTIL